MVRLLVIFLGVISAIDIQEVVFVILTQSNKFHSKLAEDLAQNIYNQSQQVYNENPVIHISAEEKDWIFLPLFPELLEIHDKNASWVFFLQEYTDVRVEKLLSVFQKYDHDQEMWFGNALHDSTATIIHHFAFYENPTFFKYPNLASGFAISIPLLRRLNNILDPETIITGNFHIDSSHELAKFVWNDAKGPMLQHEEALCSTFEKNEWCASNPIQIHTCDNLVPRNNIYFAVKTCKKFHKDRVPIVKKTWGERAQFIKYFSDVEDKSIPTVNLGVPNTETGHCTKTMAIIKHINEEIKNNVDIKWIVIADDDTILSVSKLQNLLSCYDHNDKICIGERYGFNLLDPGGYNYITGGGGMVFSKPLIEDLALNCNCPSLTTPDDMFLGICMVKMGVQVTHVPGFHQARPDDYSEKYLSSHEAISFHKHYMTDPIKIYKKWFRDDDMNENYVVYHNEL